MNKKRAAEVILEGRAFERCVPCHGEGLITYWRGQQIPSGIVDPDDTCGLCHGFGQRKRGEYLQACVVLGLEFPPKKDHSDGHWP